MRLPHFALVFMAGISISARLGDFATTPLVWLATAGLVALLPGRWRWRWRVLVLVFLLGGARAATSPNPGGAAELGVDDGEIDRLVGWISGGVDDDAGRRRFVVVDGQRPARRVLVTVRGQPLPAVLPGDVVTVTGHLRSPRGYRVPGAVDRARGLVTRGATHTMSAAAEAVTVAGARRWTWRRYPVMVQRALAGKVAGRGGDESGNAVVRAMVLGDRGGLDDDIAGGFRAAGVAHVLAVSGLHLAVVTWLVFVGIRRLWGLLPGLANRVDAVVAAAVGAAPAAVAFAFVTGARVSTLRALIVVLIVLLGLATARRARVIDALGCAALILVVIQPLTIYDPSFQLSFAAAATLVLTVRRPAPARAGGPGRRALRWLGGLARASFWASLATAPFAACAFGQVAVGGLIANLAVVPVAELVILPLGLLGCTLLELWPAAGGALIDLAVFCAARLCDLVGAVASVGPLVAIPPPTEFELAAMVVAVGAAIYWARRGRRARLALGVGAVALLALVASWWCSTELLPRLRSDLTVAFLDVGDGDAAVVELPGGAVWLIDSGGAPFIARRPDGAVGPTAGDLSVVRYLAERRIRHIDIAIISHPHPDHYLGMRAVARAVDIDELWVAREHAEIPPDPDYRALLIELMLAGTKVVHPPLGRVAERRGVVLSVLAPGYGNRAAVDPVLGGNDNSLVVAVEFAGRRILFTGDIEGEGEAELVDKYGEALGADLVKVPHHGSRTSSTAVLVEAVAPRWAVISVGVANRHGAPAPEVVDRWLRNGAEIYCTDEVGAVTAVIGPDGAMEVTGFDAR